MARARAGGRELGWCLRVRIACLDGDYQSPKIHYDETIEATRARLRQAESRSPSRRATSRAAPDRAPPSAKGVPRRASLPRHAEGARGPAFAPAARGRSRDRGDVPPRELAQGLPARPLLDPGRPRAPDRRSERHRGARAPLRVMKCLRQVRNTLAYVLLNQRRHVAKRIARLKRSGVKVAALARTGAWLDPASSARWFEGWRRDVAVDRSPPEPLGAAPAVAAPRTWFLRAGWRRYGLLDPNEIPGGLEA